MSTLRISPDLALPVDAATESIGILGQRGAGKSNAEVVLAEEMWRAEIPWVGVDPKGDWYGLRSSADGKGPGLALPVFGGLHGDVPLEAGAGRYIADLLVDHTLTAVLDVSDFSKEDRAKFLVDFFDRLFRRHRAEPHVRHVFLEEAHEYIPQQVGRVEGRLKDSASRIVLQGRSFGLGSTTASQRSARIHKDVLTQIGTLVAMRTTGPHDRAAIEAWVKENEVGKEMLASLPSLKSGEAWVWSPEFLGVTKRIRFRQRQTFDSGATPGVGQARRTPSTLADVDLGAIKEQMADTIEKAKADDPRELRKQIAELKRHVASGEGKKQEPVVEQVEVPVFGDGEAERLRDAVAQLDTIGAQLLNAALKVDNALMLATGEQAFSFAGGSKIGLGERVPTEPLADWQMEQLRGDRRSDVSRARAASGGARPVADRPGPGRATQRPDPPARREPSRATVPRAAASGGDTKLGLAERKILTALAQYPQGRTKRQVATLAVYSVNGGGFKNALGSLRAKAYIVGSDHLTATDAGLAALGEWDPLPEGRELLEFWLAQPLLGHAERQILSVLAAGAPASLSKEDVAAQTTSAKGEPYEPDGGGFKNAIGKLRTLELITGPGHALRAADELGG